MEKKSIPSEVKNFIDKYLHLEVKGEKITCPYFLNSGGILKNPIFAGKGNPYDIERTANEVLMNHDFSGDKAHLIRKEIEALGLGIDCSGLVYQIYNKWLRDVLNKGELKNHLPAGNIIAIRRYLSRRLKPEASVSADMFTSEPISQKIEVRDVRPGDLIRSRGGKHLLFVTDVEYERNLPRKITFVNSTTYYVRNGVRYGDILLGDDLSLSTAKWEDNDPNEGVNYAYKGYRELINNNGIWRPKFLDFNA